MARREICNTIDCKERLLLVVIGKDEYGGYKQDLLENDLDEMEIDFCVCSKCNGVMRNACLVNGPDQLLVCEVCNIEREDSIPIIKVRKNISELRAKCPLLNRGCVWKGILGEIDAHLDECTELILKCSNLCGVLLKRSGLQNHCENECQLRIINCKYCRAGIKCKELENHNTICLEFPLLCPNQCLKNLIRRELKSHIERECPNTLVECPYKEMGCGVLCKRSELPKHEKTFESKHFNGTKVFYLNKVEKMESIIHDQKEEIEQLITKMRNLEEECQRSKTSKSPVLALNTHCTNTDGDELTKQAHDGNSGLKSHEISINPSYNGMHNSSLHATTSEKQDFESIVPESDSSEKPLEETSDDESETEYQQEEALLVKCGKLGMSIVGGGNIHSAPFGRGRPGIYISKIVPGGSADRTKTLRVGDRILEVNNQNLRRAAHITAVECFTNSGNEITITVQHVPPPPGIQEVSLQKKEGESNGLVIRDDNGPTSVSTVDTETEHLDTARGIFISKIQEGSPAALPGKLRPGQRILEANGRSLIGLQYKEAVGILSKCTTIMVLIVCEGEDSAGDSDEDVELPKDVSTGEAAMGDLGLRLQDLEENLKMYPPDLRPPTMTAMTPRTESPCSLSVFTLEHII